MFRAHRNWKPFGIPGILMVVLAVLVACGQQSAPAPAPAPAKQDAPPPATAVAPSAATPAAAPAPAPTPAAATKQVKPSGEVVVAMPDLGLEKWDPSQSKSLLLTHGIGGPMYESLYLSSPPDGEVRPFLLESGKMADDTMSWTFKLRSGIRFSNGDPMTAEDVKFSLDRYRSEKSVSPQAGQFRKSIKNVVVLDPLTVRVELNEPTITLASFLGGTMGTEGIVIPKNYIEKVGWDEFNRKPIGSGPYKMVEHKLGESVTYEAVENHWRTTPSFAKVRFVKVPEERSRIAMLTSGQADLVLISPDTRKEVEQAGFGIINVPYTAMLQIHLFGAYGQYPQGPTSKVEVRKALDLAINKQEIVSTLYAGAGEVAPFTPSVPGYSLGAPKDLKPSTYDPAEAKRLLQQAGYPNGFDMTFYATPLTACPNEQQIGQAIASYWERIGVKTQVRPIEYAVFRPLFSGKEHASQIVGAAANHCTEISSIALRELNIYYWSKGTVKLTNVADAEIEKAQAAKSIGELVQYSEAAYRKVYENSPALPILYSARVYGASKKLAGLPLTKGADLATVWLVQDRP